MPFIVGSACGTLLWRPTFLVSHSRRGYFIDSQPRADADVDRNPLRLAGLPADMYCCRCRKKRKACAWSTRSRAGSIITEERIVKFSDGTFGDFPKTPEGAVRTREKLEAAVKMQSLRPNADR